MTTIYQAILGVSVNQGISNSGTFWSQDGILMTANQLNH